MNNLKPQFTYTSDSIVMDNALMEYSLAVIPPAPYTRTTNFVWGTEIHVGEVNFGRLENWYITMSFINGQRLDKVLHQIEQEVTDYIKKQTEFLKSTLGLSPNEVICIELCDWQWLENDSGEIVHQDLLDKNTWNATLVKYAKFLSRKSFNEALEGLPPPASVGDCGPKGPCGLGGYGSYIEEYKN